jgi:hypothetical protein
MAPIAPYTAPTVAPDGAGSGGPGARRKRGSWVDIVPDGAVDPNRLEEIYG